MFNPDPVIYLVAQALIGTKLLAVLELICFSRSMCEPKAMSKLVPPGADLSQPEVSAQSPFLNSSPHPINICARYPMSNSLQWLRLKSYPWAKHWSQFGLATLVLLIISLTLPAPVMALMLRVLVKEESTNQISVAVTQPSLLQTAGQPNRRIDPGRWHTIPATTTNRITPTNNGLVQVGTNLYPGEIEILPWQSRAIAVNILPLEEYLRSVVPSEMPASWHMDALMAQAVAARSYAINTQQQRKWGDAPYDLVSDTRDQVYKGFYRYDPQTRQTLPLIHIRSDQAVASTTGYMLRSGFKGYYRARLPRNWITWGNGYMPISDGQHLDQEMSQQMAEVGWNWLQILAWWYRDEPVKINR